MFHRYPLRFLCFLLYYFQHAFAWERRAYEAMGMTAMSSLSGKTVQNLKPLLGGSDLSDVGKLGQKIIESDPLLQRINFHPQTDHSCSTFDFIQCDPSDAPCLVPVLKILYTHLLSDDNTHKILTLPPPLDHIELTYLDSFRLFVTLLENLHQPLHLGFKDLDYFGQDYKGYIHLNGGNQTLVSLYQIYDFEILDYNAVARPLFYDGGWTHVSLLGTHFDYDKKLFEQEGIQSFQKWAEITFKDLCKHIYAHPFNFPSTENSNPIKFSIDKKSFITLFNRVQMHILFGGAHLAIVLDSLFKDREISSLRGLPSNFHVEEKLSKSVSTRSIHVSTPFSDFMKNIGVILFVLGILFYILKFYLNPGYMPYPTVTAKAKDLSSTEKHME